MAVRGPETWARLACEQDLGAERIAHNMRIESSPESSISQKRVTTSSNKLTEPVETDDSSVVNTASASAGTAVDEGDTIDGVASCAQTAQEQRGSPADSEAAGFAFVGSTDCPTPAPMGQKVSRCASFTLAAGTELPFPESIQLATADASQTAKTLHQQLPHDADGVHQEEECQTPAARRTAGRLATSFSAPEARPSTAAAGDAQPVHQRESVRPSTLQSAAAADVHGSRTTADPQQKNTALSDPGSDLSGDRFGPMKILLAVLDALCKLDARQIFTAPVPASVPGYYERILRPMCLSDMRQKLRAYAYRSWRQICHDFSLIVSNAHAFNVEGDQWYSAASALQRDGALVLKREEAIGSAALHALHADGSHAAVNQQRAEADAAIATNVKMANSKRLRSAASSPANAPTKIPATPKTPVGQPAAAAGASGPVQLPSTSFSSAGATDSATRVSTDAAAATGREAAAALDEYATEPDLCYSSFSEGHESDEGILDADLGSLFRRLPQSNKASQPLGGTVTAKRVSAAAAHLQQRIVEMPLLGGKSLRSSSCAAETLLPRRQRGKPTKAAVLTAEAAAAAAGAAKPRSHRQSDAAASGQLPGTSRSMRSAPDGADVDPPLASASVPKRHSKRKASRAWQQQLDTIAWRANFVELRMRALQHEHHRIQLAEDALQAKQGRVQGPGTPPQAGAAVLPPAAPPPTATKRRRKRAIFPHLSAAELLIHPVFGALAHIGRPEQLPTQVFMESEPHPSYTPAHQVFPASAHGSSAPIPLRLLRSNAAGFPHSNTVKHGQVGAACSLDLLPAKKRAAFSPSDAGGSPAMAARARARELSATRAASVKMGAAGGTVAEAAYAAAAFEATRSGTLNEADVFYPARAHAALDVVRHEAAGNRELLNGIIGSDQTTATDSGKRANTAGSRGRATSSVLRPASGRERLSSQPAKPSRRRRDGGATDHGTPLIATGIGAPKFVERQKAVEIPLPSVRLLSAARQAQQAANIERFRAEAKLKVKPSKGKSSGAGRAKAAGKASAEAAATVLGPKEGHDNKAQDPMSDASDEESFLQRHLPLEEEERQRFMSYPSGSGPMKSRAKGGLPKVKGGVSLPRGSASAAARSESRPVRTATAPAALKGPPPPKETKKGASRHSTSDKKLRNRKGSTTPTAAAAAAAAVAAAAAAAVTSLSASAPATAVSTTAAPSDTTKPAAKGTAGKAPPK